MGFISQRIAKLSGQQYEPGEPVPNDVGSVHLAQLGFVSSVPDETVDALVSAYDPSEHTVAEVLSFAAKWPAQVARLLDDEEGGENRTGVVEALERALSDESGETEGDSAEATPEAEAQQDGGGDPDAGGDTANAVAYDPSEHTVAEVLAYVEANPGSVAAILEAEKARQSPRVTLVESLEGLVDGASE